MEVSGSKTLNMHSSLIIIIITVHHWLRSNVSCMNVMQIGVSEKNKILTAIAVTTNDVINECGIDYYKTFIDSGVPKIRKNDRIEWQEAGGKRKLSPIMVDQSTTLRALSNKLSIYLEMKSIDTKIFLLAGKSL